MGDLVEDFDAWRDKVIECATMACMFFFPCSGETRVSVSFRDRMMLTICDISLKIGLSQSPNLSSMDAQYRRQ